MDKNKDNIKKEIEEINKKLGIEGEIDTAEEAKAVIDGQMGFEEYLESVSVGDSVEEKSSAKKAHKEKILITAGIGKNVIQKSVDVIMHESMLPYSEHVILDRALPRVEDGLKPVQRRILFTMHELGITPDKPHRKSARIVGDCLGKYHPHGDRSVYDAMVRMAQPFNMSATLVDGHGNFGSVDGDSAAAMRYTEARMTDLALEMLRDLDKDTVEWGFNFDDSLKEPLTVPARYPNLLVNGASGIAVGLATNIPPHNITEVINGVVAYIDNNKITLDEMMQVIKGPDFPTGGFIIAGDELKKAYETGKGKIILRAKIHVENAENDKRNIVITEIPYQVNKANLLTKILSVREQRKEILSGISEIIDESDRNGMRAVIKIKKDADPAVIIEHLYKYTDLQTTFGINIVAIADGKPQQMGLMDIIVYYTDYQRNVIFRRSKFELNIAKEREHIVDGLVIAVTNIDEVIAIIKKSETPSDAKVKLRERFVLSEKQAQAVLDTRLARLTSLEIFKLQQELAELKKTITRLSAIIASKRLQLQIVKSELLDILKRFKVDRASQIIENSDEIVLRSESDNRVVEDIYVGVTAGKTIKSMTLKHCKAANTEFSERTNEFDTYTYLLKTSTDKQIMAFSNLGNAFKVNASTIPDAKWRDKGILFSSFEDEALAGEYPIALFEIPDDYEGELLFFTQNGMIKRSAWKEYNLQKRYFQAVKLKEHDSLVSVESNLDDTTVVFITQTGMILNAEKIDIPIQGRISGGVKGINLSDKDKIMFVGQAHKTDKIAVITDRCFAKSTELAEIDSMTRYRKGVKIIDIKGDNGKKLVFAGLVKVNQIYDVIVIDGLNIPTCYSTETFEVQPRVSKGKSLVKSKKGIALKSTFAYLSI